MKECFNRYLSFILALFIAAGSVFLSGCGASKEPADESHNVENSIDSAFEEFFDELSDNVPNTEEEVHTPVLLSDGPVFFSGDSNSFTLTLYSLKTGDKTELFRFDSKNKYFLAIDLTPANQYSSSITLANDANYFHEQLFDSEMSRIAVSWRESTDSSQHVGWLDKNGKLTDVTNIVHPASTGFSSTTPKDSWALFTSDDKLIFYDGNKEQYCYYDDSSKTIVEIYDNSQYLQDLETTIPKHRSGQPIGLNPQNRPNVERGWFFVSFKDHIMFVGEDEFEISNNTIANSFAQDYVESPEGYTFLIVLKEPRNGISHYGPLVTEKREGQYYTPYISYREEIESTIITPQSEYFIEGLAYSNGYIVFTARRGTERVLFKMSYLNGIVGEPEIVAQIDNSWGTLFFWSDKDMPIY